MKTSILTIWLAALIFMSSACGPRKNSDTFPTWRFDHLVASAKTELDGLFWDVQNIHDLELIAWYSIEDDRPLRVDNALFWAHITIVTTNSILENTVWEAQSPKEKWALLHMARSPGNWTNSSSDWEMYSVISGPQWLVLFDQPPTNDDVYESMLYFDFQVDDDWVILDASVRFESWKRVIGESPKRFFKGQWR